MEEVTLTYGDIFKAFCEKTGIDKDLIEDYRPATPPHWSSFVAYGIIVWLVDGSKFIYIHNPEEQDGPSGKEQ